MIEAGHYYNLEVVKKVDFGLYLDAEGTEILLPKRFVPQNANEGDVLKVFVYHDNEQRLIATTQEPKALTGEIALMKVVDKNKHGAFLDWGIMKDVFLPLSQQVSRIHPGNSYLVRLYIDERTKMVTASEKLDHFLSNETLSVAEKEAVDLIVWQKTDIGYKMIINGRHTGVLHFSDVFRDLDYGEKCRGYIKTIRPENKIDLALGEPGYKKVGTERERILELLQDNSGYLPYNDKSDPEKIKEFFGTSKKSFKLTIGALYKERLIEITQTGIRLLE